LSKSALDIFCSALPDPPQLFDVAASLHGRESATLRCAGNDELTALACVAAARLFDTGPVTRRPQAPAEPVPAAAGAPVTAPGAPTARPAAAPAADRAVEWVA
jgi:hypothetical protein